MAMDDQVIARRPPAWLRMAGRVMSVLAIVVAIAVLVLFAYMIQAVEHATGGH